MQQTAIQEKGGKLLGPTQVDPDFPWCSLKRVRSSGFAQAGRSSGTAAKCAVRTGKLSAARRAVGAIGQNGKDAPFDEGKRAELACYLRRRSRWLTACSTDDAIAAT